MDFYLPVIFTFSVFGVMLVERGLLHVARRRGRAAPSNVPIWLAPPRCEDNRLNRVERLLQLVITPVGLVVMFGGVAYAWLASSEAGWIVALAGLVMVYARGIFVASCIAFAEQDESPLQVRSA